MPTYNTPTRIQGTVQGKWSSGTSYGVNMAQPANGNILIACVGTMSNNASLTVSNITQTNVSWSKITGASKSVGSYFNAEIWIGIVSGGAGTTATVNLSGTPGGTNAGGGTDICEYSGLLTSGTLDVAVATSSSASASSGVTGTTGTTTQTVELWVGFMWVGGGATATQTTPINGFTLLDGVQWIVGGPWALSIGFLEKIVSATGTAGSGTSWGGNDNYDGIIATLKASPFSAGMIIHNVIGF